MYTMKCIDFHACITANSEEMDDPHFDFCFDAKTIDDYFTSEYDLEFNYKILKELTENGVRISQSEKRLYFEYKSSRMYKSPLSIDPLDFFNLFYSELSTLTSLKSTLQVIPHLQQIKLQKFERQYLYSKLIEFLNKEGSAHSNFLADLIVNERTKVFDAEFTYTKDPIKDWLDLLSLIYTIVHGFVTGVDGKLQVLIGYKLENYQFHSDPLINSKFHESWLDAKIKYYSELKKYNFEDDTITLNQEVDRIIKSINADNDTVDREASHKLIDDIFMTAFPNFGEAELKEIHQLVDELFQQPSNENPVTTPSQLKCIPFFDPVYVPDIHRHLHKYFAQDQQDLLRERISNDTAIGEKLVFLDNGNKLADAFKKLFESQIITRCRKNELISWIADNFMFRKGDNTVNFNEKTLTDIISSNIKNCKNPIFTIVRDKNTGKYILE